MHSIYMSYKIIHAFTSLHQRCIDALVDTNISWKTITLKNDFRASLPINLPVISIFFIPFSCDHLQIHEVDQPYHSKNLRNFHAGSEEEYISISSNVKIRHCISNGTGTTGKRFRVKYEVVGTYFLLIIRCYMYQKRNFYNAISKFKNITKSHAYLLEQYLLPYILKCLYCVFAMVK